MKRKNNLETNAHFNFWVPKQISDMLYEIRKVLGLKDIVTTFCQIVIFTHTFIKHKEEELNRGYKQEMAEINLEDAKINENS